MKKDKVAVQSVAYAYDAEGIPTETWTTLATLEGVLLPYGTELALRQYGVTKTVKYRFFYKGNNTNLVTGNRLYFNGIGLYIVYVAAYGTKAMDVLVNSSIEDNYTM